MKILATFTARHRFKLKRAAWSLILLTGLGFPSPVTAQEAEPSDGFISFRFASRTSLNLYGGYDVGGAMLLFGMSQNPRSEYREVVGGVARTMLDGRLSATMAMAGAYATDGWYGQLYVLPAITLGSVGISALLLAYQPLENEGSPQFYVNPITALVPVYRGFQFGASYTLAMQTGSSSEQMAGPALRLSLNRWEATLTAFEGLGATGGEVRLGMRSTL